MKMKDLDIWHILLLFHTYSQQAVLEELGKRLQQTEYCVLNVRTDLNNILTGLPTEPIPFLLHISISYQMTKYISQVVCPGSKFGIIEQVWSFWQSTGILKLEQEAWPRCSRDFVSPDMATAVKFISFASKKACIASISDVLTVSPVAFEMIKCSNLAVIGTMVQAFVIYALVAFLFSSFTTEIIENISVLNASLCHLFN